MYELIAPCHFGMESVLKNEIYDIGYEIAAVDDGRVTFYGDEEAIVRANIQLRTAERILLKVGAFHAETYEELFQGTRAIPWDQYLPRDARFWVTKAATVKSRLFSPSDIQSIMKKAMVERMAQTHHLTRFPETGASYPVRVFLKKDEVAVAIDTTGESLHKRGYRKATVKAPIAENLAAGLILLTPWKADRTLVDPFCGSGTFPIEAAMMAAHIAPGMHRDFTAMTWDNLIAPSLWQDAREEAEDEIDRSVETHIQGYDLDPNAIDAARFNAKAAGVQDLIHFQARPVAELSSAQRYGFIITNPPYGERLEAGSKGGDQYHEGQHPKRLRLEERAADDGLRQATEEEIRALYATIGERRKALDTWSWYIITSVEKAEQYMGLKAQKNRKIYNGMIKTYFYQFPGPRPVRGL